MAEVVAQFFSIIGPNVVLPTNMQELIPYLLTVFIGVVTFVCTIKLIGTIASALINWRRF
ncbi:MAG: hypothetical protein KBS74_03080 [Clostridiales bacterium]|nr:hypothetical protein [Candidatus Cacconaster stercorequi]